MAIAHPNQGKRFGTCIVGPAATSDPSTITTGVAAATTAAVASLSRAATAKAACGSVTAAVGGVSTVETVEPG